MRAPANTDPLTLLPHRPPFLFVTRVLDVRPGETARGEWTVAGSEDFLRGHFPGVPIVPGVLLGEALAQLAGILCDKGDALVRLAYIDLRFGDTVAPPANIQLEATSLRAFEGLRMFEVRASHAGREAAWGRLALSVRPASTGDRV